MRRYWKTTEIAELRRLYPDMDNESVGKVLGRSWSAVQNMAVKLGLRKSPSFLAGPMCKFQPGHATWNKGMEWRPEGSRATQFRKGQRGARQKPVGTIRQERDGLMVKVAEPNVWRPYARVVWEQNYGQIQAGMIVRGDPCKPESLRLITRAENVRLNWRPRGPAKRPVRWTAPLGVTA